MALDGRAASRRRGHHLPFQLKELVRPVGMPRDKAHVDETLELIIVEQWKELL